MKRCSIADCNKIHDSNGWCRSHNNYYIRHHPEMFPDKPRCSENDCERIAEGKGLCKTHYNRSRQGYKSSFVECSRCGTTILNETGGRKYCDLCSEIVLKTRRAVGHRKQRYIKKNVSYIGEKFESTYVFERDNWVCSFCKCIIDRNEKWPSPLSASVDHIIPVRHGGSDTLANVRTAHLHCNISDGRLSFLRESSDKGGKPVP